jgi:hypothetical protein
LYSRKRRLAVVAGATGSSVVGRQMSGKVTTGDSADPSPRASRLPLRTDDYRGWRGLMSMLFLRSISQAEGVSLTSIPPQVLGSISQV